MKDMEDMEASTGVNSMKSSMEASVSFRGSFHGRYGRYESFHESNFYEIFRGSFRKLPHVEASMEVIEDMKASVEVKSTEASTKASMEVMEAFPEVMEASMEVTSMEAYG